MARPSAMAGPSANPALRVIDGAVRIAGHTIWSDLQLSVAPGELIAILGPNGAGKSTLLHVLLGLQALSGGSASVLGAEPGRHNAQIGYLPQRRSFDSATRVRGTDLVRLGLDGRRWGLPLPAWGRSGATGRATQARVREVIAQVGAGDYANRAIGECSGGEQQRLLIAQALARHPQMLILDEPLDSLDLPNQAAIAALVARICHSDGVSVLLVAHDVNPLLPYVDRVLYLANGRAVSGTPAQVIRSETLSAMYRAPVEVLHTSDGRLVVVGQPEAHAAHPHTHASV